MALRGMPCGGARRNPLHLPTCEVTESRCPFCEPDPERVFYRGANVLGIWDAYPVSDGHALIVTKQHVPTWFDASREEQTELGVLSALAIAREAISSTHQPDGFNIGVNIGEAAGQTVPRLHVHLIPRYKNDVVEAAYDTSVPLGSGPYYDKNEGNDPHY